MLSVHAPPRLLAIVEGYIPSADIAIRQPFEWLEQQQLASYEIILLGNVTHKKIESADFILFLRPSHQLNIYWLNTAVSLNKRTLCFLDDHFFAISTDTPVGRYYSSAKVTQTIKDMIKRTDLILVGSSALVDAMSISQDRVVTLPFTYPSFVAPMKEEAVPLVIGYFGTAGHYHDLAYLVPALSSLLESYGGTVRAEFCGIGKLEGLKKQSEYISFLKYDDDYRRFMKSLSEKKWSIGLVPLLDTPFNRCKTDVKYRDYAALGIPAIYSDVEPYSSRVEHMKTGILVENSIEKWASAMRLLIENSKLRRQISDNALADVREHNALKDVAEFWLSSILERLAYWPVRESSLGYRTSEISIKIQFLRIFLKIRNLLKKSSPRFVLCFYRWVRWRQ